VDPKLWLAKLADLRVDIDEARRSRVAARFPGGLADDERCRIAPHKPILLFCVLDLLDGERIRDGWVVRDAELVYRFQTYWSIVVERCGNMGDVMMPFHALGQDQIWARFTAAGEASTVRDLTRRCLIAPGLRQLLALKSFRKRVRETLVKTYFPSFEQPALAAALRMPELIADDSALVREEPAMLYDFKQKGRDARFRTEVVTRYRFTCAFTGYRLTTEDANIVEAAHIHARSKSLNDDPRNGLALTPNAHWMFDAGLWSVDENERVIVARKETFSEWSIPGGFNLRARAGTELFFPDGCDFRPDWKCFEWHRRDVFKS
jgi:putative restriction endonuclease